MSVRAAAEQQAVPRREASAHMFLSHPPCSKLVFGGWALAFLDVSMESPDLLPSPPRPPHSARDVEDVEDGSGQTASSSTDLLCCCWNFKVIWKCRNFGS